MTTISIPADGAVIAVITPSGGSVHYDLDKTLVDSVVIDYRSGRTVANYPPRIKSLSADTTVVIRRNTVKVYCAAVDRNNDSLAFHWSVTQGSITGTSEIVTWTAPDTTITATITCIVIDGRGGTDTAHIELSVVPAANHAPSILRMGAAPRKINLHGTSAIQCTASDPDSNALAYSWSASEGAISGGGSAVTYNASGIAGNVIVYCTVDDGHGAQTTDSIGLEVRDFSSTQTGSLIAYYPFTGNAGDASGHENNGTVNGATLVPDRNGNPNSAFF